MTVESHGKGRRWSLRAVRAAMLAVAASSVFAGAAHDADTAPDEARFEKVLLDNDELTQLMRIGGRSTAGCCTSSATAG